LASQQPEENSMKKTLVTLVVFLTAIALYAAAPVNFSGQWIFDPAHGKNLGMMAQGKIQTAIVQTKAQLTVDDVSDFNGQSDTQHTTYDLTGKPASNVSMMAGQSTTRSHWEGTHLITEWESPGAIAGSVSKRVESRYLSADGKTMYVESSRPGHEAVVMVFAKSN
jgi:hypothetical protein